MDELNRVLVRSVVIITGIFACFAASVIPVWAGMEPQPLPAYADADSLRTDSSLSAVAFADPRSESEGIGIAVGDRGALLRSTDQGQTWNLLPSPVDCRLLDVTWAGPRSVVVVGGAYDAITQLSRGVVLVSRDAGASFRKLNDLDLPLLRNLRLSESASQNRWLIADGDWSHAQLSSTFVSRDGGRTWQGTNDQPEPPGPQDPATQDPATTDSQIQSATSFVRWQRITGSPAPVRDACRIAGDRLCAVGDHGLILTSEDNGENWSERRGGDRHAAILFIAKDARSASWSLLGTETLQWRHRCAMLIEQHPVQASLQDQRVLRQTRQAAITLGAASADWFRGSGESDESTDLQARRWIAIHRPAVVVIDESVSEMTRQAVLQAAASMGVGRVLKAARREQGGSLLHHSALLPRIGLLAGDLTLDALHVVAPEHSKPSSLSLTRLYDSGSSRIGGGGESITAGLVASRASKLTAMAKSISRHRLQVVQARMKQSQLIGQMVNVEVNSSDDFQRSLQQLISQTAAEDQLRMMWFILDQTRGTKLEEVCLHEIAERFPDRSIGNWASVRIHAYQTSAEQRMLRSTAVVASDGFPAETVQAATVALSPFQDLHSDSQRASTTSLYQQDAFHPNPVQQASAFIPVGVGGPEVVHASVANQRPKAVSSVDLQLDLHPAVLLSRFEIPKDAEVGPADPGVTTQGDLDRVAMQGSSDWKRLLAKSGNHRDSYQHNVKRTTTPPRLDGKLDDPCWKSDEPAMMQGDLQLRFASDSKYFYVAVVCPSHLLVEDTGRRSTESNSRDQSLVDVDRLRLRFDTDADLWTSFNIEVTDAGRTRDTANGNALWQPTWYVDVDRTTQFVTFELAIRRSDLIADIGDVSDAVNDHWFVSAQTLSAEQELAEPVFPQPGHWRAIRFETAQQAGQQRPRPNRLRSSKLKPAGPVRLAPVDSVR